ncbi:alpha-hydroxy acid oxidase [Aquincola sp. MAHUQ-54]|uniref:Alpha-hydroxy acid oxidase n=1 Tax=Aquincola agrisoli TaxID=3119538 RepID=A0AAW9QCI1_9BURK
MRLNVEDYRRDARSALPRFVFDYVDGAAEDERCLRRNTGDLERLHLLPTCLRDTRDVDLSIDVFGRRWAAPFGIAPIGFNGLVRPRGDVMAAQAATAAGVPFVLSTASNARLEAVRQPAGEQWMQLYVMTDRAIAEQLVRRAQQAGYGALVLTVDVAVSGYRERDVRNGFKLPFRPTLATLADLARHPRWLLGMARHGSPSFVNLAESEDAGASAQLQAALLARAMDRSMVWDSLAWLRSLWRGPLLIKGLLHPDDAREAVRRGVDGIVVSNHGGRQLDAAPSTISALPAVVDAVGGALPVFIDSGFRRGSDIAKALALGARAVFVGRPAVYGLACDGERGARGVLQLLADELARTMTLLGAARVEDLGPHHLLSGARNG